MKLLNLIKCRKCNNSGAVDVCEEDYKIPRKVDDRIPKHFIAAFTGELVSIFGKCVLLTDPDGDYGVLQLPGSFGWSNAFYAACSKLNLKWLYEYRESLEYWESDYFDGVICDRVCEFLNCGRESSKAYLENIGRA